MKRETIGSIDDAYERYVRPKLGKADTVAGEYVRAVHHLVHRYEDGDEMVGVGHGNETCNASARFLLQKLPGSLGEPIGAIWGVGGQDPDAYEAMLENLVDGVLELVRRERLAMVPNHEDMYDFGNRDDWWYEQTDDC